MGGRGDMSSLDGGFWWFIGVGGMEGRGVEMEGRVIVRMMRVKGRLGVMMVVVRRCRLGGIDCWVVVCLSLGGDLGLWLLVVLFGVWSLEFLGMVFSSRFCGCRKFCYKTLLPFNLVTVSLMSLGALDEFWL